MSFGSFGKKYRWHFLGLFDRIEDAKENLLAKHCTGYGLNVGCGASRIGDVGVDMSKNILETSPIPVKIHGNAESLPFEDNTFDYAYCSELLHHADDPVKVVAEMTRVAKKVFIVEANIRSPFIWMYTRLLPFDRGCHFFNEKRIREMLSPYDHSLLKKGFLFMPNLWFCTVIRCWKDTT